MLLLEQRRFRLDGLGGGSKEEGGGDAATATISCLVFCYLQPVNPRISSALLVYSPGTLLLSPLPSRLSLLPEKPPTPCFFLCLFLSLFSILPPQALFLTNRGFILAIVLFLFRFPQKFLKLTKCP